MRTTSLRRRVTVVVLGVLVVVLGGFVAAVTLAYRSSLDNDLRSRLLARADAIATAWPRQDAEVKQLISSLALEGIDATVGEGRPVGPAAKLAAGRAAPVKVPTEVATRGSLLVVVAHLPQGTTVTLSASRASVDRAVRRLLAVELAAVVVILVVATLLLLYATRAALAPLGHVGRVAQRIAGGQAGERLAPSREDTELGRMALAFDGMVDALERAVADARAAEAAMRRFLADASHELRTPVAAVQASAETLLREQPERPARDALEARLAGDAARLGRLVDDLLGLARLEGDHERRAEDVDLETVVTAAADDARARAGDVAVAARADGPVHVTGDAGALARALRNLLDNAVAAAQPRGRVSIELAAADGRVRVRVRDDGPGVPAADRERIFDRFVQLDGARSGSGAGLGLAIARRIARQHGGELTCDDAAAGACFTLALPLPASPPA